MQLQSRLDLRDGTAEQHVRILPARERPQEMIEPMLEAFTLIDSQHGSNVYKQTLSLKGCPVAFGDGAALKSAFRAIRERGTRSDPAHSN